MELFVKKKELDFQYLLINSIFKEDIQIMDINIDADKKQRMFYN